MSSRSFVFEGCVDIADAEVEQCGCVRGAESGVVEDEAIFALTEFLSRHF